MKKYFLYILIPLCLSSNSFGFGTVQGLLGQNSEHERITRKALECRLNIVLEFCFDEKSLTALAGSRGFFGAVGYPDIPGAGYSGKDYVHCDNGDYSTQNDAYPNKKPIAQKKLSECKKWISKHFNAAIVSAGEMIESSGELSLTNVVISRNHTCVSLNNPHFSAKCRTISHLGALLHTVQDFYSHSNWNDVKKPIMGVDGLGNIGRTNWLKMPSPPCPENREDFCVPKAVITGCYQNIPEYAYCNDRVKHTDLNKDRGDFNEIGEPTLGKTQRGKINNNFARAANGAIDDTSAKFEEFRNALTVTYPLHGEKIFCALLKDEPKNDCE